MTDRAAAPPDEPADLAADAGVDEKVAETDRAIAQGLRVYVLRGLKWSAIIVFANQISRMVTSLVLVRLLQPDDYGLAGMALIFAGLVMALSDVGLGTGLVQRPSISERDRSTVFWTGAAIGVVLVTVGIAISGALASFFHEPEVTTAVHRRLRSASCSPRCRRCPPRCSSARWTSARSRSGAWVRVPVRRSSASSAR